MITPRRRTADPVGGARRVVRLVVAGAATMCVVVLLAACTSGVVGEPVSAPRSSGSSSDLDVLSLTPGDFPPDYPATRLRTEQAGDALTDLGGASPGATVDPPRCEPPEIAVAGRSVVLVGMSSAGGSLTVVTTRSSSPLSDLTDQLTGCTAYTVDNGGVTVRVATEVLPASPVDSQESIAFRRTTTSGNGPVTLTQSTTVLAAQNDGVRVYASYVSFSGGRPDGAALDAIFTKAVQKSRSR